MSQGWIKLHRKIRECESIWDDKPFSRGQAWIDLLLIVNHEDKEIMFDGNIYMVKRGQKLTSIRKLSEQWGWSRTKTTKFLNELKMARMLDIKSDTKKTLLTIVNYDIYQLSDETEKPQRSHRKATEKPQKDTNKNDKECKRNIREFLNSENETLINAFNDFIDMRNEIKKPMTERAITNMVAKLKRLSLDEFIQADILDQSINNSWQDVYPLKPGFISTRNKLVDKTEIEKEPEKELTDEEWVEMMKREDQENGLI